MAIDPKKNIRDRTGNSTEDRKEGLKEPEGSRTLGEHSPHNQLRRAHRGAQRVK